MARRGILSHKLRKNFRKANLASNASGAPNCPFHKSGKQGIWRAICENLPLRSGFSGLLRLPPQSPNTQNSSAATPRPGADVRKIFSIKSRNKESEKQKWRICFFKKEKAEPEQFPVAVLLIIQWMLITQYGQN